MRGRENGGEGVSHLCIYTEGTIKCRILKGKVRLAEGVNSHLKVANTEQQNSGKDNFWEVEALQVEKAKGDCSCDRLLADGACN